MEAELMIIAAMVPGPAVLGTSQWNKRNINAVGSSASSSRFAFRFRRLLRPAYCAAGKHSPSR